MGLVATQAHVKGQDQKFFVIKETTMGTFVKATTAASCNVLTTSFVANTKRKDRLDALMASRDILERITDKNEYSWSADMYWVPSGAKATAPDFGDMVLAAMGTETVGANDVTYSLNSNQTMTTLSMTRHMKDIFQEALCGAWVEEMKLSIAGGDEPKVSFSGGAMTYAATGAGTLNGAMAASATTMIVQTDEKNMYATNASAAGGAGAGARSVVSITDGVDTDDDVEVTVDSSAPSFTVTAIGGAEQADAADVTPYVPTHTDAGSPISGTAGTFTIDDVSDATTDIIFTAFELTLKNNFKPFDDEALTANVRDGVPGMREITGSCTFRVRQDLIETILNRYELATRAIALTCGGAAQTGTRLEISIPTAEILWSEVQVPQTDEATITLPFKALGSSGNDAFTLKHT
jgi:hypothetical protein